MKKVKLFFSLLPLVSILITSKIFSQSESSAIKEISPGNVQVTEPMIAVNPTDPSNFIAVYSNWIDDYSRRPGSSMTLDGGQTWSSTQIPESFFNYLSLVNQADPTVAFDNHGHAYYCYLDEGRIGSPTQGFFGRDICVARSTNGGSSWIDKVTLYDATDPSISGEPRVDKPWIAIDCNSNAYKNSQYVAFTSIFNWDTGNERFAIFLSYKRENGNFSTPVRVCESVTGTQTVFGAFPVVGLDGSLYVFWGLQTSDGYSEIKMRKSTDGGVSFGTIKTVKSGITESENSISFNIAHSWPYVALNPKDGSLNLVYGDGTSIYYSVSTDNGNSWSQSSQKGMKPSGTTAVWNPNIACDKNGKLSIVYYATGIKVIVACGYSSDNEFTRFDQGSSNFSTPYKFTDYIGIACNEYNYIGVWPAPSGTKSKIFGRHRTIGALVENLDQDHLQFDNSKVYFDGGTAKTSPYSTNTNLFPGKTHTLKIYSSSIIKSGSTYNFYQWEDENGTLLSTDTEISVPIDNHKYRAMFNYQAPPPPQSVTVYIKNEFKNPDNTVLNGGTVNVDEEDVLNTEDLPGQQVTETYTKGDPHRFEAKEQTYPVESFYRGFNPRSDQDGGWVFPDQTTIRYESTIRPLVSAGLYLARYRNRYKVSVNGNAPESNSLITDISPTKQIWQYESDYIFAPPTQTFSSGLNGTFTYWDDGENLNPRDISLNNNLTYTALYKYSNHSDSPTAYSNNSQRKLLRTSYDIPRLHSVYESMGRVWYETSSDNGYTWEIMNQGKPLSEFPSKCPSISPLFSYDQEVLITFQEYHYNDYNDFSRIKVLRYNPAYDVITQDLTPEGFEFIVNSAVNPVIQANQNNKTNILLICEIKNDLNPFGGYPDGLYYLVGKDNASYTGYDWTKNSYDQVLVTHIDNTDANSYTPCLTQKMDHYELPTIFHLVWEQRTSANLSVLRYYKIQAENNNSVSFPVYNSNLSNGSGYQKNYAPSLATLNNGVVKAVWQGARQTTADESPTGPQNINALTNWEYKTIYKDLTTGIQKTFGTRTNLPTINKLDNNSQFFFAYSEQSDLAGKVVMGSDINTICQLDAYGKDVQIGNGSTLNTVKANLFKSTSLPFYFSLSTNLEHVTPKKNTLAILSGREGIVFKDSAQFYFAIGDVLVDNQPVEFIALSDTLHVNTKELVNNYLETEAFTLSDNSVFYYSVQYGITDSIAASQILTGNQNINFKVELLEASSGAIIGSFDNIFYSRDSVYLYNNIAYQVNTAGIGNTQVKLRLVINSTGDFDYSLSERFAEGSVLGKMAFKQIDLDGSGLVKEYDLAQNFPNPFNPSTTIRYQIPQDGIVILKIYDILGSEVATFVNEKKVAGKYEVNFNASSLASGVYIYKIQAGSFINSKKMILLK
jgi:hypothetical protein